MKQPRDEWFGAGRRLGVGLGLALGMLQMALAGVALAQAVTTTTVQGTVYLAGGQVGAGTLNVSWPAFTTASGQSIAAGHTMVPIAPDGYLSVNLAPNLGATPAGLYYTAVYQMSDGTTSTQYWVIPAAAQASLAQVQAQLMPAAQAVQAVSKAYVDQSIAELTGSLLTASGGTLSGNLYLNSDPTQPLQAADKHYVDSTFATEVPIAGGIMTGPLAAPAVNGVEAPVAGSTQTTLQAAVNAAGTSGAVEIPPTYAGTDTFTNPNGVPVTDLRQKGAQQFERSVKEFGAVCDGVTDDTNALQSALNYAETHGVALTIPQGTCKTHTLNWHGESIGGLGKQVSALMGFPGQDVLATSADSVNLLSYTRLHDLTIYVDQSVDASCSASEGRAAAGSCAMNRPMESNSIFSADGNGLNGTNGTGAAWAVGNCAIAMPAVTGAGGNGLKVAVIENLEIAVTGVDPMAQYAGAHSTHICGIYLAQWPRWSEFRNIDICGLNTGIAIPALPGATPAGLGADSNRWEDITIAATHGFTAAAGSNNVLDNVVVSAGNSAATGETPTGLVLDFAGTQQGWIARNAQVTPTWNVVQPQLTVTAAGGAVTGVTVGSEHGLGFDPYGTQAPLAFSGSCTAQATAAVGANGAIGTVTVTQGGVGCSGTTTASVNVAGTWDTAAVVNLIGGQNMSLFGGNLLKGNGGYTVWNAAASQSYGTQVAGGGGTLPGGGSYPAMVLNNRLGTSYQVDQFPGVDFGAKLQACLASVSSSYGGTCDARNFAGTQAMGSNLTISTANATVLLPCTTIATANQVIVTAGTRNVTLRGCALRGASTASGSQGGTVFLYSGKSAMVQVGDPTYAADTSGFHMDNAVINTTASTSASARGLVAYRTQEMDLAGLYFLGNSNQTGMTLDGTGNYTGGSFYGNQFDGFQTAVNAIGHQVANPATTDWMNASTFVRLHIDCPTSGGNPINGTYGINLQQGDGNTFTGGDVEGCGTALHLGANAQNNTIVGLRNENSTNQVVADAGSSYNNWMTGGTMFTGKLTDNGTRNSFLDSFHRTFNGMNGDWYGSQQDATVTNHWRLGIGTGNERGLLTEIQTDYGYRWVDGYTDATAGEQYYQVQDLLNNVTRLSIGQYNNGQSSTNNQTVLNAAGTGSVVLNGSNNAGTGGVVFGSGGASETTVATVDKAGNAQFNGTLQVAGVSTLIGTPTVKNQADAEIDAVLWAGQTQNQKESLVYKDFNGNSQWYAEKDASNNWELNSATGGLDSFKAYQSTNSGDTYINASNATGHIRLNYEPGSGSETDVYGGGTLIAKFSGLSAIEFPGLASAGGYGCAQLDASGWLTNSGTPCSTAIGTVSSGNAGQVAYYTGNGTALSGMSTVPVTAGGTGAASAAAALANMGGVASTTTVNGHALSGNVMVSASDLTTGTLPHAQLPGLVSGDVPNNAANTSGTAGNVIGTVAIGNGGTGAATAAVALANLGGQTALGYTPLKPANNLSDVTVAATALANLGAVAKTITVNGHALSGNVTVSASDFTTGILPHAQLPALVSGDVPNNAASTTGTAANVTGTVAVGNGGTGAATASAGLANLGGAPTTTTVNGHALSANVTVSASDLTTGTLPHAQLPALVSGDIPNNAANTAGTAANVTGTVAIGNGGTGAVTAAMGLANLGGVATTTMVNGHALSGNVTVSASDLTTGTLAHAQLPALVSADVPNNAANTTGTAANVTALSNSTLTSLPSLGLAYSQLTGTVPTWNQNTTGTAANVTGTVSIGNGGTGAATGATALANLGGVASTTTVNGHALNGNVTVSASDLTTGTLAHAQLPALVSGDVPNNAANTTGTAANVTALSNSTLTSLPSLGLAYSQLTGTVPTWNQNTSGTAGNVTGTVSIGNGGTGALTASAALANLGGVASTTTVNGHALTGSVTVSASDLTTGALPHAQLPELVSGDIPNNAANTTGTAGNITSTSNSTLTSLPLLALAYAQLSGTVPTWNQNTSGTAGNVTGTVAIGNGGTGALTAATALANLGGVASTTTVNGHALNGNVTVSASDFTTGTLPHAQLPALVSGDVPNNAANTSGTAATITGNVLSTQVTGLGTAAVQNASAFDAAGLAAAETTRAESAEASLSTSVSTEQARAETAEALMVPKTNTVNGHQLSLSVVVSASDLTTGTLPHAQLPTLASGDIPNNAANTTGSAASLSANIAESQVTSLTSDLAARVPASTTVNGHVLSTNVVVSASDITSGTLPHAQLPALVTADIPNNAANTTGTAANVTGTVAIGNGGTGAATAAVALANLGGLAANGTTSTGSGTANVVVLPGSLSAAVSFCSPVMGQLGVFIVDCFPGTAYSSTQLGNAISAANTWGAANLINPTLVFGAGVYTSNNQMQMPVNPQHWTWNIEGRSTTGYTLGANTTVIKETGSPTTAVLTHPDTGSVGDGLDTFYIRNITISANYKAPCMQLGDTINVDITNFSCYEAKGAFAIAYADPAATGIGNGTGGSSAMTARNSSVVGDNTYNFIAPVVSCPYSGGFVNGTACTVTSGGQFDSSQNNSNGIISYIYGRQQGGVSNPCTPNCTVTFTTSSLGGSLSQIATVTESVTASNSIPVQVLLAPNPNATIGQYAPGFVHDSTFIDVKANGVFQTGIEDLGGNEWFHPHAWSYQQVAIWANGSTMYSPVADTAQRIGTYTTGGTFYGAQYVFAVSPPSGYIDFFVNGSSAVINYFGDVCGGAVTPSSSYYFHMGYNNDYYGWDNPNPAQLVLPTVIPNIHGARDCETPSTPELEISASPSFNPSLNLYSTQTSVTGTTAGHAVWSEPEQGLSRKSALVYLNGYENTTATAQTITLPTSFATVGYVATDGGSCTGVTVSGATVTLPSSMGGTQTGLCKIEGY